jgi:hypothetical protein
MKNSAENRGEQRGDALIEALRHQQDCPLHREFQSLLEQVKTVQELDELAERMQPHAFMLTPMRVKSASATEVTEDVLDWLTKSRDGDVFELAPARLRTITGSVSLVDESLGVVELDDADAVTYDITLFLRDKTCDVNDFAPFCARLAAKL